tara:strand:- start:3453 stop:3830 length:378 start_codon:yes stop_codon:yes gene_type:complete
MEEMTKEERKRDNAKAPHEFIVQDIDEKSHSYHEAGTVELVRYIPEIEQSYVWHLSPEEIDRLSNALEVAKSFRDRSEKVRCNGCGEYYNSALLGDLTGECQECEGEQHDIDRWDHGDIVLPDMA